MKSIIIILFLSVFSSINLMAQNKIAGKILDNDSLTLPGARIFLPDLNKGAVSDKKGNFEIANLPNGRVKIQISYIGYSSVIQSIDLDDQKVNLDIYLKQSAIESEEIVVTGGSISSQHEMAVNIQILKLTPLEIKATPNFAEILTKIPGVDMISKGPGVSKPVIRGLSANDILVLNNGVRFENYQYSSHHPMGIDEFGIENVEIIKGPASLLYGSDAIGGVINFIKEKPITYNGLEGDYNLQLFSNTLGITNNFGLRGASDDLYGSIRIGNKSNSDFLQGGGDFVPNSRFNEFSFKTNIGLTNLIGTFNLYYDYNNQKLGLIEDEAIESVIQRDRTNRVWYQQFDNHLISSQNRLYFGKFKIELNTSYQNTELIHFGEENFYELQMQLATLIYEAKIHLPVIDDKEFIIGFQGINQTNTNLHNRATVLLPDANNDNYSLFGLFQFTFFEKLNLQAGLRYDYRIINTQSVGLVDDSETFRPSVSNNYNNLGGSLGATYNFTEEFLIRGNFASSYRTPNLAELTSNGQHELRYELGNSKLTPQSAYESDLNFHYHKSNLTIDIAGFYNIIDNYIFITPTGTENSNGIPIYRYEQANSVLYGYEIGLHLHPEPIKWLHLEATFASVVGKKANNEYLPFIPANKLNFEIRIESTSDISIFQKSFISINSSTAFDQHNPAPDETSTDSYTLFDFSIGSNININNQVILVTLGANNILDSKYIDHLSTLKEVNLFNPGRNITLTINIPFGIITN